MKAATWWAEYLRSQGVRFAFGQGGLEVVEHLEALRAAGIELVWTHHESVAAFAAAALGELTAIPGLCVATRGPGATNLLTGVAHACLDRAPLLAVTGETDPASTVALPHQNLPLEALFAPVVKSAGRLTAKNVRSALPAAFDLAAEDPLGPVYLAFPQSEARREVVGGDDPVIQAPVAEDEADPRVVVEAIGRIDRAKRPVLFVGLGARELEAERLLVSTAERLGAPVVVTPKAKGHFPADHPLFAGVYPAYLAEPVEALLHQADLVLGIGLDPVEMIRLWPFESPVVSLGPVDAASYFPDCLDVRITSHPALARALGGLAERPGWPAAAEAARRELGDRLRAACEGRPRHQVTPLDVLGDLRRLLRRDSIVTCDVGSHRQLTAQAWPSYWPRTFLTSNGLSSVGFALPAAMAAKLSCPDRLVACLVGDGGLLAVLGDLQTLARLDLGVLLVVWADEGSSNTKLEHEASGYETPGGTFTGAVDFEAVARSLGIWAATIDSPDSSTRILESALARPGPSLVQVPLSYEVYRGMAL